MICCSIVATLTPNIKLELPPKVSLVTEGDRYLFRSVVKVILVFSKVSWILLAKLIIITEKIAIENSPPVNVLKLF
jgi:hypothetical protein